VLSVKYNHHLIAQEARECVNRNRDVRGDNCRVSAAREGRMKAIAPALSVSNHAS